MSTTDTETEGSADSQQYEHIVLVAANSATLAGDETRSEVETCLDKAGEQRNLPVAGTRFADDRVHVFVENPRKLTHSQLLNNLKVRSERVYLRSHTHRDKDLRWSRGFHAGVVAEGDLP